MTAVEHRASDPDGDRRIAVLISGRGSNLAALIKAAKRPEYPAEIVLVISNRPEAAGLACAAAQGVASIRDSAILRLR